MWRRALFQVGLLTFVMFAPFLRAAPKSELWAYWSAYEAESEASVDHGPWQSLLSRYVMANSDGINRVAYRDFDAQAKSQLRGYLRSLSQIQPTGLNRQEQLAYWINLYNAQTIQVVLDHPKKNSILSMGPFLAFGPWDEPYLTIEDRPVSLNDIEHRILRPIWQDHRLHFVLNCASLGCPNLSQRAFVAAEVEQQLSRAESAFLTHPRAISFGKKGRLQLTSLFDWYLVDFAGDVPSLLNYLASQRPDLAEEIAAVAVTTRPDINYVYDWDLNVVD